ncbi:MAG: glutamine synthetase [Thermomicrobiales bacterium]|nr:glutamine synthetase [Thermomicrobiales bacterium]
MAGSAGGDAAREALARLDEAEIAHLWVVYTDYNGRSQGKAVPRSRFASALDGGISFARANLGHDVTDHQAPDTIFSADSGDFFAVPDPAAIAPYPLTPRTARAICWMRQEGGAPWDGCPRTAVQRQVERLAAHGLTVRAAFEPEGYLFRLGPDGQPQPFEARGMFTIEALDVQSAVLHAISETLEAMGVGVEQAAPEYGPGQIEINLRHAEPIKAADDLVALKDVTRAVARQEGLVASFMPKPFENAAGCGLHIHLSLWNVDGSSAMEGDDGHPSGFSPVGRAFMGGLLAHARALCGIGAPTFNSAKRLQPGSWAPAHAAYAPRNRSALVRIPSAARRRIEFRAGDNTSNPYLLLAALLAAGLDGIERDLDPGAPAEGDLGHLTDAQLAAQGIAVLPRSTRDALDAVAADETLLAALGPILLPEWLKVKRSELATAETIVSPWERAAYLRV